MMRFDHAPAVAPFDRAGPAHGADFVSLWSDVPWFGPLPSVARTPMPPADASVAMLVQDLVVSFARNGMPQSEHLPPWPRFQPRERPTLLLSEAAQVVADPIRDRRAAWQNMPW
jgi:para-nitrobenzyl esterase